MKMKINFVQDFLSSTFTRFGEIIGKYPHYFVIIPVIITLILAPGMMNMTYNRNVDYLFVAEGGRAEKNRNFMEKLFPLNTSIFTDFPRFTRAPEGIIVFVKGKKSGDMLNTKIFTELNLLDNIIKNISLNINGDIKSYSNLCGKIYNKCNQNPILDLIPHSKEVAARKLRIKYPIDIDNLTYSYRPYTYNLGGVKTDVYKNVENVEVVRLFYILDNNIKEHSWIKQWEKLVVYKLKTTEFKYVEVYAFSLSLLRDKLEIFSKEIYPLITIVVATVSLFSIISNMTNDLKKSKPWLGMSACISAGLAVASSFGLASFLKIENTDMNIMLPFLVLGMEVDDSYVLISAWRSNHSNETVEKRIGEAYSKASISITITSITNLITVLVGISAPFPIARLFCMYAALCILFTYLYQITFFGGCMAFSGYSEYNGIRSILRLQQKSLPANVSTEETIMKIFRTKFSIFLSNTKVKILLLLLFFIKLSFGLWGLKYLENGLDTTKILPANSDTTKSVKLYFEYFTDYPFTIHVAINKTLNYADINVQKSLERLVKKFESDPHIAGPELTLSWLKFYKLFLNHDISKFSMKGYNLSLKQDFIDGLRLVFLKFKINIWQIEDESDIPIKVHCVIADVIEQGIIIRDIVSRLAWMTSLSIMIVFFCFIPNFIYAIIVALSVASIIFETIGFMALWKVNLDMISLSVLLLSVGFSINYLTHLSCAFVMSTKKTASEKLSYSLYHVGYPIIQVALFSCFQALFVVPIILCFVESLKEKIFGNDRSVMVPNGEANSTGLSIQFSRLGRLIARQPLYFIISPIIITAFFCIGITRIKNNRDSDNLFTAENGRAHQSKKIVDSLFSINTSSFIDPPRLLERNEFSLIQITAKDGDDIIRNITVISNGQILKYKDICGHRFKSCLNNSIFDLMHHSEDILQGKYNVKFPVDMDTFTYYFKSYILDVGGVTINKDGYLRDFKAARIFYILDISNSHKLEAINQWQNKLHKIIIKAKFDNIIVSILSLEGIKEEIKLFSEVLLPLIPAVILSVSVFSFLTCLTNDWIRSKPWLGPSACISAGLAITSGFGLMFFLGIEYVDFSIASTYVVLSTEIDDAFVLIAAWRKTDAKKTVEERMGKTYSEAAVSITITSVTNILSFCIGMASSFPGVRIFCAYGASAMFFTYVYQITFFGGCMALSGYREHHRLHPFTFKHMPIKGTKNEDIECKDEIFMAFFRDKFGSILKKTIVKIIIGILFFINLGFGIWGLCMIESGNNFSDVFTHNSSVKRFTDSMYQYFGKYTYPVHIVFDQPLNYADESVQVSIDNILKKFEEHPHMADTSLRLSWLKYYKLFMKHPAGKFMLRGYNISQKQDFIDGLRFVFLKMPQAKEFSLDIVFNDNHTEILASRFLLPMKDISSQDDELKVLKDLNDIVDDLPMPITIHSLTFHLLEQAIVIKKMAVQVALLSALIICIVFFIFVPNVACVISTAFHAMFVIPVVFSVLGHCDKSLSFNSNLPEKLGKEFILISESNDSK
ncbi:patched domain-containing protein 3-like [Centruroides sculpturatus]|uniref:patched domain-containing protein 3-like n=1 Tax=Centruroides sculpturatus TaxID=218467 RepID=UPI000C6D8C4C|nr:patched domain-containing protein 3-like [Centruroides sculpturatus]